MRRSLGLGLGIFCWQMQVLLPAITLFHITIFPVILSLFSIFEFLVLFTWKCSGLICFMLKWAYCKDSFLFSMLLLGAGLC